MINKILNIIRLFLRNPIISLKEFNFSKIKILLNALDNEDFNDIEKNLRNITTPTKRLDFTPEIKKSEKVEISQFYPFDRQYYIEQLKNKNNYESTLNYNIDHYKNVGYKYELSPNILFDPLYYVSQLDRIPKTNLFDHFIKNSSNNIFISPHPLIDIPYIISKGVITKSNGNNILEKIINYYQEEHEHYASTSPIFAVQWYLENNSSLKSTNPLIYFLRHKYHNGHPLSFPKIYYEHVNQEKNYLQHIVETLNSNSSSDNPKVSIIVLNWNKSIMTIQCVATILNNTDFTPYEIIIVDNGSNDEDYYILNKYLKQNCKIIRNKFNRYFGEANNLAVEESRGDYIVFLNNDAFVHKGWLKPLIQTINSNKDCGGVGSLLVFPNGNIQESGGQINLNGIITQENKGRSIGNYSNLLTKKTEYKSAASFAMKKSDFLKIGGFDYIYEPAYFEDTDLCMKIRTLEKFVYSCPKSVVTHIENLTSKSKGIGFNFNSNVSVNRKKFSDRWDKYLSSNGKSRILNRIYKNSEILKKNSKRKTAFVYTPYDLKQGGGEKYILSLICSIVAQGYFVYLCTEKKYSTIRLYNLFNDLNLDLANIKNIKPILYANAVVEYPKPDIFVTMGNSAYPDKPAIGCKLNIYHCQFPFPVDSSGFKSRSENNLKKYDFVIVNSYFTKSYLNKLYLADKNIAQIIILNPPVFLRKQVSTKQINQNIISVGRFFKGGHNKNHQFMIDAFKVLSKQLPNARLYLVGGTSNGKIHQDHLKNLIKSAKGFNIEFQLDADNETLERLYNKSSIYWHATGIGVNSDFYPEKLEHFGMTIVEAINHGLYPIVYEFGGPAEQISKYKFGDTYDNLSTLTEKTITIINRKGELTIPEISLPSEEIFNKELKLLINSKVI